MHGESGPLCNTFELIGVIESSLESVYCYHHICFQHMAPGPARYPQLIKCISENTQQQITPTFPFVLIVQSH